MVRVQRSEYFLYILYIAWHAGTEYKIGKQFWSYLAKLNSHTYYDPTTLASILKKLLSPRKHLQRCLLSSLGTAEKKTQGLGNQYINILATVQSLK